MKSSTWARSSSPPASGFDPTPMTLLRLRPLPERLHGLEVERLLNASGPTEGKVVLRDGSMPKRVGIVHCVGSRDHHYHRYCSRVCCMYSLKLAHLVQREDRRRGLQLLHRHPHARQGLRGVLRTGAAGRRALHPRQGGRREPGIGRRRRGAASWSVQVDDTLLDKVRKIAVDMVILAVALEPRGRRRTSPPDVQHVLFGGRLLPGEASQAGTGQHGQRRRLPGRGLPGPEGHSRHRGPGRRGGAEALALIDRGHVELEPNTAWIDEDSARAARPASRCVPTRRSAATRRSGSR